MPDITMCVNIECPFRKQCYRYRAIPSDFQSYANFDTRVVKLVGGVALQCDNFWEIKTEKIDDFTKAELRNKVMLKNIGEK